MVSCNGGAGKERPFRAQNCDYHSGCAAGAERRRLAARYVYLRWFAPAQATVTVPDNLIGEGASQPKTGAPEHGGTSDPAAKAPAAQAGRAAGSAEDEDGVQAAYITLFQGRPDANRPFEARGLLPGDHVTQYFCIKASHTEDIPLYFRAEITEETKALGE